MFCAACGRPVSALLPVLDASALGLVLRPVLLGLNHPRFLPGAFLAIASAFGLARINHRSRRGPLPRLQFLAQLLPGQGAIGGLRTFTLAAHLKARRAMP